MVANLPTSGFRSARLGDVVEIRNITELAGRAVDAAGVAVIVPGTLLVTAIAAIRISRRRADVYHDHRRRAGRSILLGLEFLVAGDIIRTRRRADVRKRRNVGRDRGNPYVPPGRRADGQRRRPPRLARAGPGWACTPSVSTRRRPGGPPRAPRTGRCEPGRVLCGALARRGTASTITSHSDRSGSTAALPGTVRSSFR
ncbi:DUF1622 domain-containing protein [Streptomyces sp. 900105755]